MKSFKEYIVSEGIDKSLIKKLEKLGKVKTKSRTASLWYSPNTEYKIDRVDDGFYSKKPGIHTEGGFIPLKDLDI